MIFLIAAVAGSWWAVLLLPTETGQTGALIVAAPLTAMYAVAVWDRLRIDAHERRRETSRLTYRP